ncbi:hypothetical protein [Brevundimonas sp.]|uniref:hypothetical protein n=1 Tax=Brevundimonas sp. TaxID=1871086 RepID=UPI003D6CD3EE
MGALTTTDLALMAGEPRVTALRLAETLGFEREDYVRRLISRHREEVLTWGVLHQTDGKPSARGGRPLKTYWLTEPQALLVCMFARTEKAAAVRKQVIEVFLAWRHGELDESAARPSHRIPDQWERMSHRLGHAKVAMDFNGEARPEALVRSVSRLPIWQTGHRPRWWSDADVRTCVILMHRQMQLDQVVAVITERYGEERAPSRSSIHRFWLRLDALNGRGH